jgi:hypothetical protein
MKRSDSRLTFNLKDLPLSYKALTIVHWFANLKWLRDGVRVLSLLSLMILPARAEVDVYIPDVPDYEWFAGCTGTGSGIIMGYWDRHGFPNFYTGLTAGGVAPLDNRGTNYGFRAFWASWAGMDGRATDKLGHVDDYWSFYSTNAGFSYESPGVDPYKTANRPPHTNDCLGDFIGLSQNCWTNMNGECDGNIDSYGFVYWDKTGARRDNFIPHAQGTNAVRDIPSGWLAWTKWRGYSANVFSQLTDFNPMVTNGTGFTFSDVKREINAGYPILFYQQNFAEKSRRVQNTWSSAIMTNGNPRIHAGVIFGYYEGDGGSQWVYYRSTWGDSDPDLIGWINLWDASIWMVDLPVRGVCGYHPLPKITSISRNTTNSTLTLKWDGPSGQLTDNLTGITTDLHYYVVERSYALGSNYVPITATSTLHTATFAAPNTNAFYRVKLLGNQ